MCALPAGFLTHMVEMGIEGIEGLLCLEVFEFCPAYNAGNGGIPALAPRHGGRGAQPECTAFQLLQPFGVVKYSGILALAGPVFPPHAMAGIAGQPGLKVFHLVVQSLLHTYYVRLMKQYLRCRMVFAILPIVG